MPGLVGEHTKHSELQQIVQQGHAGEKVLQVFALHKASTARIVLAASQTEQTLTAFLL
jgi:hypothetical protein